MPEDPIHQSHDKLFKAGFSDPVNTAAFLKEEFPAPISARIDWAQLQLEAGSFVDSHYRHCESDLLFSAPLDGSRCLVYLLFEHQTARDPLLALRLLRYMVRIWESWLKEHPDTPSLPVILPVVLAQNAVAWTLDPSFSALLDMPVDLKEELRPYIPDFHFRMIQLAQVPFDAIRGTPAGILILRTMKAERVAQLLDNAVWDESLIMQVPREVFEMLLRYILAADIDKAGFESKIQELTDSQARTNAMTLAQQYRQEGRQEGTLISQRRSVLGVLEERLGPVPDGLREEIEVLDNEAKLNLLLRKAAVCADLEEFSRSL